MSRLVTAFLLLILSTAPATAAAQGSPPLIRYGKWLLAAGAIGFNLMAAESHQKADDAFDTLENLCFDDFDRCDLGPDGTYLNPRTEALYQTSLHYDRETRTWLIVGETALVASAGMFVWELARHTEKPDNIPFEPEVRSLKGGTGIGLRFAW
ncbi:MAG TPA: hypothetical protein VJQ44_05505 [Gemmatimonadales bacterium]|nr:hypothetical protein [Gemmatimonadales bacterium]